jgi:transposase
MYNINEAATVRTQNIKGVDYVYEDTPYWDREKKQNRHRREYIGKLGENGEFVPNKKYLAKQAIEPGGEPKPHAVRTYCGATHLLDEVGRLCGIEEDIRAAFPNKSEELLSLAYYLALESESPMYRFPRWASDHRHPCGYRIDSQRISEIMRDITEEEKMLFFKMQTERRQEKEYLAYDTTSVSSWSEYIKAVRYGKNKDDDNLPQVNMALVFGEESSLPVYYRVLPGNISDVTTVRKLLKDVEFLEIKKLKLVMDRGFYSAENVNALYKGHYKFLIATKSGNKFVAETLREAKKTIRDFTNYDEEHDVYAYSTSEKWHYVQRNKKGETVLEEERRIYVHVYYNGIRAEEEKRSFTKTLSAAKDALASGKELSERQQSICEKYFVVKRTPKRGVAISYNEAAISEHMDGTGYFVLLSNEIKDPSLALRVYRKKDVVEKAFDNLKERLEMRRTTVRSDQTLQGKFFLQFLALIYVSYIHKCMRDNDLYRNYTMQTLIDSLDVIELFEYDGQRHYCGEITDKQRKLYAAFGVNPPDTL